MPRFLTSFSMLPQRGKIAVGALHSASQTGLMTVLYPHVHGIGLILFILAEIDTFDEKRAPEEEIPTNLNNTTSVLLLLLCIARLLMNLSDLWEKEESPHKEPNCCCHYVIDLIDHTRSASQSTLFPLLTVLFRDW